MKKAISIFLALVLCISLCACGSSTPHNTTPAKTAPVETIPVETIPAYDKQNLESILAYIDTVTESAAEAIEKEADTLMEILDNSYENYKNNQDSISACYATLWSIADNSFSTLRNIGIDTYSCIISAGPDDYDTWGDAMWDANDTLCDAYGDIYVALYCACDTIFEACNSATLDARNVLGDEDVSDLLSAMYDSYQAAWEEMYDSYQAAWEEMYDEYWAVRDGFVNGETDVDAILKAYYEEVAAATEATQPAETTAATVQKTPSSDIDAASEGFDRLSFSNEAFRNYEIWQNTQDESMYIVNLNNLTKINIIPLGMYDPVSGKTINLYSVKLVHHLLLPTIGQYLPYFAPSFADPWNGYYAVDFGGKVAGLWGFSCPFAIAPDDSSLDEETVWVAAPLGSMCADDYLGYQETSVEYSTLSTIGDVPNWIDYLTNTVSNEIAGFAIMPQLAYQANKTSKEAAYSTIVLMDVGGFTINYDFAVLHFDSLEHVAEFIIPQWEAYENQ